MPRRSATSVSVRKSSTLAAQRSPANLKLQVFPNLSLTRTPHEVLFAGLLTGLPVPPRAPPATCGSRSAPIVVAVTGVGADNIRLPGTPLVTDMAPTRKASFRTPYSLLVRHPGTKWVALRHLSCRPTDIALKKGETACAIRARTMRQLLSPSGTSWQQMSCQTDIVL
jgi:hypothetical protein